MNLTLEGIGLTKEKLQERVIGKLCDELTTSVFADEDGDPVSQPSSFKRKLDEALKARVEEGIGDMAAKYVLPNVTEYLEKLVLTKTNEWGQKQGEPVTFIQYLVQRCDAYMREEVNYEGKTRAQDSYNWRGTTTRVSQLIDSHLHHSIEKAMKDAMALATGSIKDGLSGAVKMALERTLVGLKTTVEITEKR
jgi:hypothetical protein